jgi:imidazoleglycerol-phosphate dehydratase/histidinol-phosphatase
MKPILFLDRDGTLLAEPDDQQIDRLDKFALEPDLIPALRRLREAGYALVMVTNQDGLGTGRFPAEQFQPLQDLLVAILRSQGIEFEAVRICPHLPAEACGCRKPRPGLLLDYLRDPAWDRGRSLVIGDRDTDLQLAAELGIRGLRYQRAQLGWREIARQLLEAPRRGTVRRTTRETDVAVTVDLDTGDPVQVATGIGFFDHMLEQIARHAGIGLCVACTGDLRVDEHHTVEDTALALGQALRAALGDRRGLGRYGFVLPMDEALANVALDLSGRAGFWFEGRFPREAVGGLPTELVPHFFRSLCDALGATLHLTIRGDNAHHMVEALFKGFGRALRPALARCGGGVPSTKGVLA